MTVTRVGIVEWARRARGAVALHRAVADALGRCIDGAAIGARLRRSSTGPAATGGAPTSGRPWCPCCTTWRPRRRCPLDPAVEQALADLGRDPDGTLAARGGA